MSHPYIPEGWFIISLLILFTSKGPVYVYPSLNLIYLPVVMVISYVRILTEYIHNIQVQIGKEKCWGNIDVSANDETSLPVFPTNHTFDENIPCNFVKKSTKVWNNLIGDWTFNKLSPAPTSVYKYRVTNEIMVPIPLETIEKNLKCGRG